MDLYGWVFSGIWMGGWVDGWTGGWVDASIEPNGSKLPRTTAVMCVSE